MMNKTKWFTVPGDPQGKGRPRFTTIAGHARAITPDQTVLYENLIKTEYIAQHGHDCIPAGVPLIVRVYALFSIPASASKKKRELMLNGTIRPVKKPDGDNILKVVADSLNGIAYYDDAQIVEAGVIKFYSDIPKLKICIEEAVTSLPE